MTEPRPVAQGRREARALRADHGLGTAPIADLFSLVERLYPGTLVIRRPMPEGPEGALIRSGANLLLVVNTHERMLARQRFTAAHELGHQIFDSAASALFVERSLFRSGPLESRANAFAVNLLLPVEAVAERRADGRLDLAENDQLVGLSLEYGLSLESLGYHLLNHGLITERRRSDLRTVRPLKSAGRLGHVGRAQREFDARNVTRWPSRFVQLAMAADHAGELAGAARDLLNEDGSAVEWLGRMDSLEAAFDFGDT